VTYKLDFHGSTFLLLTADRRRALRSTLSAAGMLELSSRQARR
jgi:hypothetical protein